MLRASLLMAVMLHALPAAGQSVEAIVGGRVSAAAGSALPGATITLVSDTATIETAADSTGRFAVPAAPGTYAMRVTLSGYCEARREGVTLSPLGRVHVDVVLVASCGAPAEPGRDIAVRALDAGVTFHLPEKALLLPLQLVRTAHS